MHSLPPYNFCGLEQEHSGWEKSRAAVLPVPFDSTSTYLPGSRNGPHAIISASRFLELYDDETGKEVCKKGIFTFDELEPVRADAEKTIGRVEDAVQKILEAKKFPLILGGEHTIAVGAVKALKKSENNFSILCLDAHMDLRDELEKSLFSHACTSRRIHETNPSLVIVGARSFCREEKEFAGKNKIPVFGSRELSDGALKEIAGLLEENVYFSIDLDALDPAMMPSVSCPEPGGMSWSSVSKLLKKVCAEKKILGMDLCELTPIPGLEAPNFLAAKLAYKALSYALK